MNTNIKANLLDHSKAKIELYGYYLSTYLRILQNVPQISKIFVFDLLSGEGLYENNSKGSPLIALDIIDNLNKPINPSIELWFNDNGISEIDTEFTKIERLKKIVCQKTIPANVHIKYYEKDFNTLIPLAINKINTIQNSKGLFFIDPYGYKDIDLLAIKNIMAIKNCEILLFSPISFMYRFAKKSMNNTLPGLVPLSTILNTLFSNTDISFSSSRDFIRKVKDGFIEFIGCYVTYYFFERGQSPSNIYCIFFFTNNELGLEKMIAAKYKFDPKLGKGFKSEKTIPLFSEAELSNYDNMIEEFIASKSICTNRDLYVFGLKNEFLPRHTNPVLNKLKKEGKIIVSSLDGKQIKGNYIFYNSNRLVRYQKS